MTGRRNQRKSRGQSIIEVVIGGSLVLVPIALFALDLVVITATNSVNDHLAREAARAAANQATAADARRAAQNAVARLKTSPIIVKVNLEDVSYVAKQQVSVKTSMEVKFPAPFPGFAGSEFVAQDTQPVVGAPADM